MFAYAQWGRSDRPVTALLRHKWLTARYLGPPTGFPNAR